MQREGQAPPLQLARFSVRLGDGHRRPFRSNSLWRAFPDRFDSDAALFS
jgi:hypothetical protein